MKTKKNDTPSCINNDMKKIDVNSIRVFVFTMPEYPYSKGHH